MYDIILDSIIDEMNNFGVVSQIVISMDCYQEMTKQEINHLDSFLYSGDTDIKWVFVNDREKYFHFRYSTEPFIE